MNRISMNDPESIQKAVAVLRAGGVIVYPTDTAYGLGVDATNPKAVEKIFTIKGRDSSKPVPVIVGSVEQAGKYVVFNVDGEKLVRTFWPGALTLVFDAVDVSLAHIIHGGETVGVRVPQHEWCQRVAHQLEHPVTSTSANGTNMSAEYSLDGVERSLGESSGLIDLWVDGGTLAGGPVSTVVLANQTPVVIKREGAISGADIKKVLE